MRGVRQTFVVALGFGSALACSERPPANDELCFYEDPGSMAASHGSVTTSTRRSPKAPPTPSEW